MSEVVFRVYQVFYTKTGCERRKALKVMIRWCIKEYIRSFKKEETPLNVMTNEVVNLND